jgi:hypothetical protein
MSDTEIRAIIEAPVTVGHLIIHGWIMVVIMMCGFEPCKFKGCGK